MRYLNFKEKKVLEPLSNLATIHTASKWQSRGRCEAQIYLLVRLGEPLATKGHKNRPGGQEQEYMSLSSFTPVWVSRGRFRARKRPLQHLPAPGTLAVTPRGWRRPRSGTRSYCQGRRPREASFSVQRPLHLPGTPWLRGHSSPGPSPSAPPPPGSALAVGAPEALVLAALGAEMNGTFFFFFFCIAGAPPSGSHWTVPGPVAARPSPPSAPHAPRLSASRAPEPRRDRRMLFRARASHFRSGTAAEAEVSLAT